MLSDLKCTQRICEKFCERIRGAVGLDLTISQFMGALILAAGFFRVGSCFILGETSWEHF